jgi:hypothetical protein
MKQTPQMQRVQDNMRPGAITLEGFLGSDTRNLGDILIEDDAEVKRMGLNHEEIASRMNELREAGKGGLGEFITVPPNFEVRVDSVRGKLPCPFEHPGLFPKTNITVRNTRLDREVTFTDLQIHLIEAHGFYEGKGSRYRIDPEELAEVLELESS